MKIFIDFDGVIVDTIATIVKLYNKDNNESIDPKEIKTWNFEEYEKLNSEYMKYFSDYRFFSEAVMMKDAIQSIYELYWNYHDIIFCTKGTPENLRMKKVFLETHFNAIDFEFIGIDLGEKDKSMVDMKDGAFIDDMDENLSTSNANIKICFGEKYPWNNNKKEVTWEDVLEILSC